MPVPPDITALSAIAASNSPLGSESPATADDYFRAHAAFIAQLRAVIGGASDANIPNAYATTVQVNDYVANQSQNSGTTGGTLTAYTLAPVTAITSYAANKTFWAKFHVASGASPTIQISGLSSPPTLVRQIAAGTYAAIGAGEIPAGHLSRVTLLSATQALVEDMPPPADVSNGALQTDGVQVGRSGTASNNFHWRNLLDGLLRLTRGNAGTPITDVMRVKADNSVEFPGGISGGFAKEYVSAEQTITLGAVTSLTHGLGAKPKLVTLSLIFKTADLGYAVDDEIDVRLDANNNSAGASVGRNATTLRLIVGASGMYAHNASGAVVFITPANCRLIVRAWL
jgi:hypothetical protein